MAVEFSMVSDAAVAIALLSAEPVELAGLPGGRAMASAATAPDAELVLIITADAMLDDDGGDDDDDDEIVVPPTPAATEAIDTCWACVTDTVIAPAAVKF